MEMLCGWFKVADAPPAILPDGAQYQGSGSTEAMRRSIAKVKLHRYAVQSESPHAKRVRYSGMLYHRNGNIIFLSATAARICRAGKV